MNATAAGPRTGPGRAVGVDTGRPVRPALLAGGNDFYARQALNRRRTAVLVATFVAGVVALGLAIDAAWIGFPTETAWPVATLVALVVALCSCLTSYFGGATLVLTSLHAQPLRPEVPEHRQVLNIVTELALAAGLPPPRVFLIADPAPNALAAGRDPEHSVIAVTQGLLNLLDREETQGVVAHELAHIGNRDTLTMTTVAVLYGAAVLLADWARRSLALGGERRRASALALLLVQVLVAVAPLQSRLQAMAVSRQREYLADATAVQFTRNPLGLARALEKIGLATSPLRAATRATAPFFISDPLRRRVDDREGRVADLLSTHPPLRQRIAILRAMAHGR